MCNIELFYEMGGHLPQHPARSFQLEHFQLLPIISKVNKTNSEML